MINPHNPQSLPTLKEYPFNLKYHQLPSGLLMNYVDQGEGPPVIMVHGNPTWSFFYRHLINKLSSNFRCLVPDHIGMGFSSRPTADDYGFKLSHRIFDLSHLLNSLKLEEPAHLVVHDWGGPIGLGWAGDHPDKVASLTIFNTATRVPTNYRLPARLGVFKYIEPLGDFMAVRHNLFVKGIELFGGVNPLSEAAYEGYRAPYTTPCDRLAIGRFVADIPMSPTHPSLETLATVDKQMQTKLKDKPMTIVWGLRDFVFNREVFFDWKNRFPQTETLVLPEAGHFLLEDLPDVVAARVHHFISSLGF
ncbi:MAG: alpha/beta fold hydrolase [Candidatus Adiutrix sp.]